MALAVLAVAGDDLAGSVATAAGPGHAEEALLEGDLAGAAAGRAGRGGRAGGAAAAGTRAAGFGLGDLEVGLRAEDRLLERQLQVVAQVSPAPRPTAPTPEEIPESEQVAQDVGEVGEDRRIEPGRPTQACRTVGVVSA